MRPAVLLFALVASGFCQDPALHPMDQVDKAHRSIFQPPHSKPKIVGEVTSKLAGSAPRRTGPKAERKNYIDQHIFGRMEREGIPYAAMAGDEEFLRRAYLDATGRIPSPDDVLSFVASKNPHKRDELIDRLVDSDAFVDRWTFYFEDLFRAGGRMGSGLNLFHYWVREWLKLDRPYNEVATELLTGTLLRAHGAIVMMPRAAELTIGHGPRA